jgi:hypothetical protein
MRNTRETQQRNMAGAYWLDQQRQQSKPVFKDLIPVQRRQPIPSATIQEVRPEFDVEHQDLYGMDIHLGFTVLNAQNRTFTAAAHFYFAAGKALMDLNGDYCATDGTVCVWRRYKPRQFYIGLQNIVLFMPYPELHMGTGNHNLGFCASIWDDRGRQLTASDLVPFTLQVG